MQNSFITCRRLAALPLVLTALTLVFGNQTLLAATRTWTGNSITDPTPANRNNFWTNGLNWATQVAPVAGDDLVFPSTNVSQLTSLNTFASGTTFNSITVGNHQMTGAGIALNSGISATAGVIGLNSIKLNNAQTFSVGTSLSHNITSPIDTNGRILTLQSQGTLVLTGVISGSGGISKTGTGTAILTANNSYTAATFLFGGTLQVNGAQPASAITIGEQTTLAGTGTVGPTGFSPAFGGASSISPGNSGPGVLTINGGVNFDDGSGGSTPPDAGNPTLNIELNGTTVGTQYDQLNVIGSVTLDAFSLRARLNVTIGAGFTPAAGDTFVIINNGGTDAVTSIFQNHPEGSTFTVGTTTFAISYKGGDGNDVILHVPTTRTWVGNGVDGNWKTASNWFGGVAPQVGDSLVFPTGGGHATNVNNYPDGTTFDTITVTGGGYDMSGNAINLTTRLISDHFGAPVTWRLVLRGAGGVTNENLILSLTADNTYTGTTIVNRGQLFVDGNQPNSAVLLNGGILSGTGRVGPITAGASASNVISPGTSQNALPFRVAGNVNLSASTAFADPSLRTLQVAGTVNLGNASMNNLVNAASVPALGVVTTIIDNDGTDAVIGTFKSTPEGSVLITQTPNEIFLRVSYIGGTGNDVTLTRVDPPTISVNDVTVTEGNTGTVDAIFTVTVSYRLANQFIQCTLATADGTGTAGSDYVAISSQRLSFGTTDPLSTAVAVQVKGDTAVEPNETFTVNLSAPSAAIIAKGQGTGTILNDDAATSPTPTATPGGTATPTPGGTATPTPTPTPTPAKALNISTRLRVERGDNVMIAGFIITGNASKEVVVRGMGPLLGSFGITDFLADPFLDLRGAGGSILKNNNWKDTQRAQIEGSPLQPGDDRESVIVATLAPDAYTAILTGNNDTTGVGLIEVYDNSAATDSQLANISTRGLVQGNDSVMIGGFILGGSANNSRIAMRGIGPSLAQFGLKNVLANPTLELHDGNGATLITNDDWETDSASAAQLRSNGLALPDSKEAGIFASLPPGAFTAILAGKNGGSGIGLIEIYNLQ